MTSEVVGDAFIVGTATIITIKNLSNSNLGLP